MKKTIGNFIISLSRVFSNLSFIVQLLKQKAVSIAAVRILSLILITALLIPMFLFNPIWQTQAQSHLNLPIQPPAPISAPPQPFAISDNSSLTSSVTSTFGSLLSFGSKTISSLFDKPKIPAGLEQPENQLALVESPVFEPNNSALLMPTACHTKFDFDGDCKADVGRWHSSNTEWKVKGSVTGNFITTTIGSSSSVIAPGDFDGDGKTDVAVFNAGTWTIKQSSNAQTVTVNFGISGDKPVVGDYDGDLKSDIAVFRPSTYTWWILYSSTANYSSTTFGAAGDITVQGDFDGDGKADITVFRPSTGDWHVQGSSVGYFVFHWGVSTDIPVPGYYDTDSKMDFAVYRGSTGTWYISKSSQNNTQYFTQVWGNYGDQPVPADYDGDGKDDFAVWRPTNGVWYIIKSDSNLVAYDYQTLGQAGDTAISSAYLKQIGGAVVGYDLAKARVSPINSTGGTDIYSRNLGWSTSLVGLSGRAGLGAGFDISYNSLVWTKEPVSNAIYFDADNSNVSPGFRFGFPTIEPVYWDKNTEKFNYLMVTSSGKRIEFRQLNGASDTYETGDSNYTQLKTNDASNPNAPVEGITIFVNSTNGTQMKYQWKAGAFRCSEIKDHNGNFITITHDNQGLLKSVKDTLGRITSINYDSGLYPISITQTWKTGNGDGSDIQHTGVVFTYSSQEIKTKFSGLTVIGPPNGTFLKVLQKITFPSETDGAGPSTVFSYNSWGQVSQITNYAADNHELNHVKINLPVDDANWETDCPRFTETRSWVEDFNKDQNGLAQDTIINNYITENAPYNLPDGHSGTATRIDVSMVNDPYNKISKTFVGNSGWIEGLPIATEDWANGTSGQERKRWTWANWTQDDTNLNYIQNPRVVESRVGDATNLRKTTTDYRTIPFTNIAEYGLVSAVYIYDTDQSTILKKVETDYNMSNSYISRRIIGLPTETRVYGRENSSLNLISKVTYAYDEGDFNNPDFDQNVSPIQHDNENYGASFIIGRANLTKATRWDISGQTVNKVSQMKYNTAGSVVGQIDPMGRAIKIGYTDAFNDDLGNSLSRNTYAYPTKLTDSAGYYSEINYRYDIGANVWSKSPDLSASTPGKISKRIYDLAGRLQKQSIWVGGTELAYKKFEYPRNQIQSKIYSTISDTNNNGVGDITDEVLTESWVDGAGRARKRRIPALFDGSGNVLTWIGQKVEYDILGRVKQQSELTEVDSNWMPTNDDQVRGWQWTSQEYDWKGRITEEIGLDSVSRSYSYDGCGCAGGEITTIKGEVINGERRTEKIYTDILGRDYKTEIFDYDDNVYTTNVANFNGRDQVVSIKQYQGAAEADGTCPTGTCRESLLSYDGHGRLKTQHTPEQDTNKSTTYTYLADDHLESITDARGASSTFAYNSRGLIQRIDYSLPHAATNFPTIGPNSNSANLACSPDDPDCPPGGPPPTPNPNPYLSWVTFSYDAAGNRTNMTDSETGTTTYDYDSLSRMIAEHKQLRSDWTIPTHNFDIQYSYHLNGQLKSVTDPFGQQINYGIDKIGRLKQITGTPYGANGQSVTNYINEIQYRSWGGVKQISYGNDVQMTQNFDSRLRLSEFEVKKTGQSNPLIKKTYEYYNDDRLKFSDDSSSGNLGKTPEWFDRAYKYDFMGRMTEATTGIEARGGPVTDRNEVPYKHEMAYNVFGELNSLQSKYWTDAKSETHTWLNGRDSNWSYDSDGRVRQNSEINTYYDALGAIVMTTDLITHSRGIYHLDGEGKLVRLSPYDYNTLTNQYFALSPRYFIYSTVLGKLLTEVNSNGTKKRTFVYGSEGVVATQNNLQGTNTTTQQVRWEHRDPSNASYIETTSDGGLYVFILPAELDPMNANVGLTNPNQQSNVSISPSSYGYPFFGDPFGGPSCYIDWMLQPSCGTAFQLLQSGTGVIGPLDQFQRVIYNHKEVFAFYRAYTDGYGGYVPSNATYIGNGFLRAVGGNRRPSVVTNPTSLPRDTDLQALNGVDTKKDGRAENQLRYGADSMIFSNGMKGRLATLPENLEERVLTTLSNKACQDYIESLLTKAAELGKKKPINRPDPRYPNPNAPVSTSAAQLFKMLLEQGGVVLTTLPYGGTVSGYLNQDAARAFDLKRDSITPGTILIGPRAIVDGTYNKAKVISDAQDFYFQTAIHELHHLAGLTGYDDQSLAEAAMSLPGATPFTEKLYNNGDPNNIKNIYIWGSYFENEVFKHCGVVKK